jgi:hypothetical protein
LGGISSRHARLYSGIHVFEVSGKTWMAGTNPAMTEHGVSIKTQTWSMIPKNWEPVCRLFRVVPGSPHHGRQVFIDVG